MIRRQLSLICLCLTALLYPLTATAETADPAPAEAPAPMVETPEPLGFTIELSLTTVYLDRGLNVFGQRQRDANWIASPSLSYAIQDTGLSLTYWGAYQLNGANRSQNIRNGTGHEQDFIVSYENAWLDEALHFEASLNTVLYPFATTREAGTRCPVYLEPSLTLGYSTALDLSLQLLYSAGLQKAIKDYRYLYLRPHVTKTFTLNERVDLLVGVSYGYKLFNARRKMTDNVHDVAATLEPKLRISENASLAPAFRLGWTNLSGRSFVDGLVLVSGLTASADF